MWIVRYLCLNCQEPFFLPCKKPGSCTSQGQICMKNDQNGGASLNSFFQASWLHA